jgi:hypothetical protein
MNASPFLAGLLLLGVSMATSASQNIAFGSGRAMVPLPESFQVVVSGNDVAAKFGADGDHTLELSFLADLTKSGSPKTLALDFVKAQATKRNAKVETDGERVVFSEPGAKENRGGRIFQSMHWQIGVGNCVFTMTLRAPLPMSKELDEFLGDPLNTLINKLSCYGP